MDNLELPGFIFNGHRLHHAAARLCPVTRIDVNMLAPQALRAMVGVAAARNFCPAMRTDKILPARLKFSGRKCHVLILYPMRNKCQVRSVSAIRIEMSIVSESHWLTSVVV